MWSPSPNRAGPSSPIEAQSSASVNLYYDCFVFESFVASCSVTIEADVVVKTLDFDIEGLFVP